MMGQMSAATLQYRAAMRQPNAAKRDLGPEGGRPPEAVLRTVRVYGALQREARAQRVTMMALYRGLEALGCPPFGRDGCETTRIEVKRLEPYGAPFDSPFGRSTARLWPVTR